MEYDRKSKTISKTGRISITGPEKKTLTGEKN